MRRLAIVVLALTATGTVGFALPGQAVAAPRWHDTATMVTARSEFAVVASPDGSVLAVGGSRTVFILHR